MPTEPIFSGATLNNLIGEADACRSRAKRLRVDPTTLVERHGLTALAVKGNEQVAAELDLLRAVAELMNADPNFANFVRVQLDPRTAVLHEAVSEIQDITLALASAESEPDAAPARLGRIKCPTCRGAAHRAQVRARNDSAAESTYQQRHGGEPVNDEPDAAAEEC